MENKKNIKLIIILVLLAMFIILIPIGYALFSDTKQEEGIINVAKIEVVLEEDPEWEENEDEYGIKKYTKAVKGVSKAEQDAYVRIKCIPIVQYYDEETSEWITASVSQNDILLNINSEDWVYSNGYWYYKKVLKGYEETGILNINWQVLEVPTEISTKQLRTDVRVILEYAQASNNMWKEIFGIENLPNEVELVQE